MNTDVRVRLCHLCQLHKAKHRQCKNEMLLPQHSQVPFEVVYVDFAEIRNKSGECLRPKYYFVAIDQCTQMVAVRPGRIR